MTQRSRVIALAVLAGALLGVAPLSSLAAPGVARSALPFGLNCRSEHPAAYEKVNASILIQGLNDSEDPVINLDGGLQEMEVGLTTTNLTFNNGCDNNYDFVFITSDLVRLKKNEVTEVVGLLRFSNAFQAENEDVATTVVRCSPLTRK